MDLPISPEGEPPAVSGNCDQPMDVARRSARGVVAEVIFEHEFRAEGAVCYGS